MLNAILPARAQQTAGISGYISDPAGEAVSQASVVLINADSGARRSVLTDLVGSYSFLQLPAGSYQLRVEKHGFKTSIRSGVALAVNQAAVVNISLQLGPITETVVVTANAPIVAPTNAQTSGLIAGPQIRDLPLNGRSYDELLTLTPGIVNYSNEKNNTTPGVSNSAVGNMFSVSGRRPQENLFLLNGVEYTGSAEIDMTPGGASGLLLGAEAVREFNVLKDFYGAQYGKRPGAQILIVTRSGTNDTHGSAYDFFRNGWFDARNFFDQGSVPAFHRNQFGGDLGGALVPNRTFLFGDYEGFRQNLRLSDVTLVPDNNARLGILPTGSVHVSPLAAQLLSLWPVQSPNTPFDKNGIAEAFSTPRQNIREDFGTSRLDRVFSETDTLSGTYTVDDSADRTPTANPLALDIESLREQVASLRETHVLTPAAVNTARFGYSRASYFYTGEPSVSGLPGFLSGQPVGAVVIGGSATPNTPSSIAPAGSNYGSHLFAARNLFTYEDQIAIVKGIQQIAAGMWFQRVQSNDELALGQYGQATFSSLEAFLTGDVTTFTAVPSPTPLGWRSWEGAWFIQDELRLTPFFNLSLGFRDAFTDGWNEAHNRAANFIYGPDGQLETQPRIAHSAFIVNRAKFLPQPRIGIAWAPFGSRKTVLRAGFGMYNDLQDALSYRLDQNAPFNTSIALQHIPLPEFPLTLADIPANYKIAPAGVQPDLYTPTVIGYLIRIDRQFTPNTAISVGYAGSHGYHETLSADLNQPTPVICPSAPCPSTYAPGTTYYPPGAPLANPALGNTWTWISAADSNYNAMEVDFLHRLANGFQFRTAYTWSKSLDDGDTLNASAAANAPGLAENAQDLHLDYGPSTFDMRQVLSVSGVYDLPFGPGRRFLRNAWGIARILLGGWSLDGIAAYNTGFPFTPELSFNPSNNGNTTNPVRPSLNPAFSGRIVTGDPNRYFNPDAFVVPAPGTYGNLGRDVLYGPGLAEADVALVKNTRLSERVALQLRGEAFNVANHANFNTPNLTVFTAAGSPPSGSAGVITSTATASRQIQIAAKVIW